MNTEIARLHVVSILEGHLDEITATKLMDDATFMRTEIGNVFSAVNRVAKGGIQSGATRDAGMAEFAEEFISRLKNDYPRNFQE